MHKTIKAPTMTRMSEGGPLLTNSIAFKYSVLVMYDSAPADASKGNEVLVEI